MDVIFIDDRLFSLVIVRAW